VTPLENVRAELTKLRAAKDRLEAQIAVLEETERILEPVYGTSLVRDLMENLLTPFGDSQGLTDKIRRLLIASFPGAATPTAIRDLMVSSGMDTSGRSNFLSEIHNVLKRLVAQDEVEETVLNGSKAYRCTGVMLGLQK
jgi:hypothetical protein